MGTPPLDDLCIHDDHKSYQDSLMLLWGHPFYNLTVLLLGKQDIQALLVRCNYADIGCPWLGALSSLPLHTNACKFVLRPCPKQCKDDQNQIRKFSVSDFQVHLERDCPNRDYECIHCGEKGIVFSLKENHFKKCKKFLLPCPNDDCSKTIQRQCVKRHLESCPYQEIPCKYMKLGCGMKMKRKDLAEHVDKNDQVHLVQALDAISSLEEKAGTLWHGESMTFKVTDYKKKLKNNEKAASPSFYTPNGHHMTINIYVNGRDGGENSHISTSISAFLRNGEPARNFGTVSVTLLNQLANEQHHTKTGKDFPTFIGHASLDYNAERNIQYLKDDALYFKVMVNVPNQKHWLECKIKRD